VTRNVSPEFSLLAACALAPDEVLVRRAGELGGGGLDWERFRHLAVHHSLLAMAGARLEKAAPGILPQPLLREAREEQTRNLALHLAQAQHTARLVRLLGEGGVRSLVLKGVPLALSLYPENPEWRYSSDIDLLVDPRDIPRADELLRGAGHHRSWPDEAMASRLALSTISKFAKDYQYHTANETHYVELHWRLTLNPHILAHPFEDLHADGIETDTGFGPVRSLDGPVLHTFLAWHAVGDIDHVLKWFADVIRMRRRLEERGIDCDASLCPSHQPRLPVDMARGIERMLFDDQPQPALPQVRQICREMDQARRLDPSRTLSRLPRDAAYTIFLMRMVSGARAKSWFVWRMLVDPRDAMTLGGRPMPALVYAIAGPLLALGRYLRRFLR
jgi:hypothetical protein